MREIFLNTLIIFLGGGIGASLRYFITLIKFPYFTIPTFLANIIGCFILGFIYSITAEKMNLPNTYKLFLTVGFCGGLTTFSTFSLENFKMLEQGLYFQMFVYMAISVIISLLITIIGVYCGKQI